MQKFIATENDDGRTLFKFLIKTLNKVPKSKIEKIFRLKEIVINSKRNNNKNYLIKNGDEIIVYGLDKSKINNVFFKSKNQKKYDFKILYEDQNILVVSKSQNIAIHSEINCLDKQILNYLNFQQKDSFIPSHVNRIDKKTSGIMVYAKNYQSLVELKNKQKFFEKIYLFESDIVLNKSINVFLNLKKDEKNQKMIVIKKSNIVAKTIFYQENGRKFAKLITGKKHQIRVSLEYLNNPVKGDLKYGGTKAKRLFLHSWKIKFLNLENNLEYLNNKEIIDEIQW
ncbi:pseudouridine synthase [[Mycoplasma] collis]|uniref:pseudouridine synthase n=1 Tax=[Mycoplasma] collis TaxID=2127 RepID=UPI00051B2A71|nr:RluA family pseudouridine synthase [[Mycoplasma] collis]